MNNTKQVYTKSNQMLKSFEQAQAKVIKELESEPADNGMHAQWLRTQIQYAKQMTVESMHEILKTNPSGVTDESANHGVATMIQSSMK
jgi:hypothetical protein